MARSPISRVLHLDERADLRRPRPASRRAAGRRTGRRSRPGRSRRRRRPRAGRPRRRARTTVVPRRIGERVDDRVGLELDARLDPGRGRIDDGDAGEHVRVEDAVAQERGDAARSTRVFTPSASSGSSAATVATGRPVGDEVADGVRQVELALGVVGVEPRRGRAQSAAAREDVDRRVQLADRELLGARRRAPRRSRATAPDVVAHDAAVRERLGPLDREERHARRRRARCSSTSALEHLGREERRVAGEHEHVAVEAVERRRAAATASPVPRGSAWTASSPPASERRARPARSGEQTTTSGVRPERPARRRAPSRRARRPEQRVEVLRAAGRIRVPRPAAMTTAASGEVTDRYGWGGRIRTSGHGTKTRCLTAWLRPIAASRIRVSGARRRRRRGRRHAATTHGEDDRRRYDERRRTGRAPAASARRRRPRDLADPAERDLRPTRK